MREAANTRKGEKQEDAERRVGEIMIEVPRDCRGAFESQIVWEDTALPVSVRGPVHLFGLSCWCGDIRTLAPARIADSSIGRKLAESLVVNEIFRLGKFETNTNPTGGRTLPLFPKSIPADPDIGREVSSGERKPGRLCGED